MNDVSLDTITVVEAPRRRLSPWRVILAILVVIGIGVGSFLGEGQLRAAQADTSTKPWFASYVDVTATPTFAFEQMGTTSDRDAVLSFIVALPENGCEPSWGGAY